MNSVRTPDNEQLEIYIKNDSNRLNRECDGCKSAIVEVLQVPPLGIKSVMVFIMKSSNRHMAIAVSHAVCVRQALSFRKDHSLSDCSL